MGLNDYAKRSGRCRTGCRSVSASPRRFSATEVILLDEPTAGLDPANARQIRDLVASLRKRATVVVSSHNLAEIQELCDHVAILDRGRLVTYGAMADLTAGARELDLRLSRPLDAAEIARLTAAAPVDAIDGRNAPDYQLKLKLGAGHDWDAAVTLVLKALLDVGVVPRRLHEGRSLRHFYGTGDSRGERSA